MPSTVTSLSATELAQARARLGLTPDQLAAELGMPPHAYAACEAGRARLPRYQSQLVAFRVAAAERDEALERSGLPGCAWLAAREADAPLADAKPDALAAHARRIDAHVAACEVCQARERFLRERFPEMPSLPLPGWLRVLSAAHAWVGARPEWLRPVLYGAALVAALTTLRAALLLGAVREPRLLLTALAAMALGAVAGAGGGLVYALLGRPARRVPVVGPYLAGIVACAGYLGVAIVLLGVVGERPAASGGVGSTLAIVGLLSLLVGPIVGHQLLRSRPADA